MDEDKLIDLFLEGPSLKEALVKNHLERYDTASEAEQKTSIIIFCADCLRNEKEQWAWDILVELAHRKPINQILLDVFLLPMARGEIKNPRETRKRGAPPKDPFRDSGIASAVFYLKLRGYSLPKAYEIVGKKVHLDSETVRSIWRKRKNDSVFNRRKLVISDR